MGTTTTPYGLYKPANSETGWGTLVSASYQTLNDRMLEFGYNAKATTYGAVFDNATDTTTAVNAAITACNAAGGGRVILPLGTGIVTKINMKTGVILSGQGAGRTTLKLKNTTNTDLLSCVGITDFGVENLSLDGNKANNATGLMCLWIDNGVRFFVRNVRSINAKMDGFYFGYTTTGPSSDGLIENVSTTACDRNGISITDAKRLTFINPVVETAGLMGIDLETNTSANLLEELTFINPTVLTSVELNYGVLIQTGGTARAIAFINPIGLDTSSAFANMQIQSCPVFIHGGHFAGSNAMGIYLHTNAVAGGIAGTVIDGLTITGATNTGIEFGSDGVAFPDVTITNCRIRGNGGDGIYAAAAQRCSFTNNHISNNGTYGIRLADSTVFSKWNTLTGNVVYDDGTNTQTQAIVSTGSSDKNTVVGNYAYGTTNAINLVGANNTVASNTIVA